MSDHVPGAHATLSPSSAERWITCPASVRLAAAFPDSETTYAREGTAAHAYAYLLASKHLGALAPKEFGEQIALWRNEFADVLPDEDVVTEIAGHALGYVEHVLAIRDDDPNALVFLEQRVQTGIPACWGTADCIIIGDHTLDVIDFKYGQGVVVEVEDNPQLRLYGIGALEQFGDLLSDIKTVRMTIYQPRVYPPVTTTEIPASALRVWRDSLLPVAEIALAEGAPFGPSAQACRWCPASGQCRAQLEAATLADFGDDPDLLSPTEIGEALAQADLAETWVSALRKTAMRMAYDEGQPVPGWKVVRGRGRRSISDANVTAALEALAYAGYSHDEVATLKLNGITALEKLLSKNGFRYILGDLVTKSEGNPALVPDTDPRPHIDPNTEAARDFDDES